MNLSRGEFLKLSLALTGLSSIKRIFGNPLGLPIGIQPYTVRNDLQADFEGTLRKLVSMGYQEIELSGGPGYGDFYGHKPGELRKVLSDIGLHAPSCHYHAPQSDSQWTANIKASQELGVQYMLCSSPPEGTKSLGAWKRTAELFNRLAKQCRDAGIQFAYHNHNSEFRVYEGVVGYDELLRTSDKDLVKMEVDCFWMTFAGKDPVEYFKKHPGRFPLLHIKDLKPGYKPTTGEFKGNPFTEVGNGAIDWKRIFAAARQGGIKHYFVEQDMWDRPSLESAQISVDYLKKLVV
jgi:sugar phosphate isomerase/epimerase